MKNKKGNYVLGKLALAAMMCLTVFQPAINNVLAKDRMDTEFKIASYNIAAKGGSTKAIGKLLKDKDIDYVGFQEVDKYTGRNNKDMLKEIAEEAGFSYYFRKSIDYSGGEYGIGMAANSVDLIDKKGADLDTSGYEGRGWQRAVMTVGDKKIAVYNTHLTWEDQSVRAKQMKEVLKVMNEDNIEYKVLTGDFNAQESNDEFDVYLRNYNFANGKDGKWLDTYIPSDASMKTNAIDNIITTRNIKIKTVEAVEEKEIGSDHRILTATCELLDEEETSTQLLDKQITKANELLKKTDRYTEESLLVLANAVQIAQNAKKDTQDDVNAAVDALNTAIAGLVKIPSKSGEPVAWWDFDGEEPLKDKTNRGNDGVEKNTVSFVPGLENLGNALSTIEGYVSVAKVTDDLNLGTKDYSVGFWYKAKNPGDWAAVLGDKNWDSGKNPGVAVVQGQGQFYTTYAANGHGQQENIVGGTAGKVYDGKWHYVAAVLDRDDESMLYVDGKMIASTSIASTANADATVQTPFNIGADGNGGYRIDSLIDDVKVYNSVLTQEEIEAEYLLNGDKSAVSMDEMIKKTEYYLKDLVIDTNNVDKLPTFKSEDGTIISRIFCSENDQIISDEGNILRQPIVDKKVQITYIVQENKADVPYDEGTMIKNKWITVKGEKTTGKNKMPKVVPTMQEWYGANGGSYAFNSNTRIVVSEADMSVLRKAAEITKSDIKELFGQDVPIVSDTPKAGDVFLTFENGDKKLGEQGYALEIGDFVTIRGTEYRGVFFGTRSLLQGMLTSENNMIAYGTAIDYPNYPIRKFMLDIGRKYFPMWYLEDLIKYASWLKLTDFQSHLSEDTFNDYSAFRLESDIPNLTSKDGYYTKDEYRNFQNHAADYGVRVITEIDGPAHSRQFINLGSFDGAPDKYKNLGLDGTHFNLSAEGGARGRVLNLMDEVLEEYLGGDNPVITTDAFNVGMDEYFGDQNDLRAYAVHMYDKVVNTYGKTAFGWDSNASLANENYPKDAYPMDDIVIDYWKWEEVSGGMKKLMDQGYKVVNGDHRWYIVPGAQIGFYDYANEQRLYNELSAGNMVGWYGNGTIFPEGHPNIVGGTMLLWNDRGMFAGYTVNDIFARQRSQYPYLAQSYWYGREDETFEEFKEKVDTVEVGPGLDNLNKDIKSDGEVVYDFDMEKLNDNELTDTSTNGYNATVTNALLTDGPNGKQLTFDGKGYIEAQHKALKWPYTAMFDLTIDNKQKGDIVLFEETMPKQGCVEKDGKLTGQEKRVILMKEQEDGTYRLTYSRENFSFEHDFTFKKGQPYRIAFSSDESKITGGEYSKWNQPNTLYVNGELVSTLQGPKKPADFSGSLWWVDSPTMNMPLEKIGQKLVGSIDNFQLYNRLLTSQEIAALGGFENSGTDPEPDVKNLALNKPTDASSVKVAGQEAKNATDGDFDTRWGSNYNSNTNDPFDKIEWLSIDLGKAYALSTVKLHWQDAYAKSYAIQVSDDGVTYTDVVKVNDGDGKEDVLDLAGATGRYLRIYCTEAVPSNDGWKWNYGYSLYEVEAYESTADKKELQAIYETCSHLDKDDYTTSSWTAMEVALKEAKDVLDADDATTEDITKAVTDLKEAKEALVNRASAVSIKRLRDVYDELDKLRDLYDEIEFADAEIALKGAEAILKKDAADMSASEVENAYNALLSAMDGLEIPTDKSELKHQLDIANLVLENVDKYISSTINGLNDVVNAASAVYQNKAATQKEINDATDKLIAELAKARLKADKHVLDEAIKLASALDLSIYEADGVKIVKAAYEKAQRIMNDVNATQEEVDAAAKVLQQAISKLVKIDAGKGSVDTGDNTSLATAISLMMLSSAAYIIARKRRRNYH